MNALLVLQGLESATLVFRGRLSKANLAFDAELTALSCLAESPLTGFAEAGP